MQLVFEKWLAKQKICIRDENFYGEPEFDDTKNINDIINSMRPE
jgi:hypothetical protein